jgi:hypothetical protein
MVNLIGYWHDFGQSTARLPHPQSLVDPLWEKDRRPQIIGYLNHGSALSQYMGHSYCRFGCGMLGTTELTDGVWAWPEGLSHYVEVHQIKLPEEFVAHATSIGFRMPRVLVDPFEEDLNFWILWCKQYTEFKHEPKCHACTGQVDEEPRPATSRIDELVSSLELRIRRALAYWWHGD